MSTETNSSGTVVTEDKAKETSKESPKSSSENVMKKICVKKITLNIGVGKSEDQLKKGIKLLQKLSPNTPVKTKTKKRIPAWGLRPGLVIGCKVTVRKDAEKLLQRLLVAKDKTLALKNFDEVGNFSFGVPEYIDIEGLEYDPDLKIIGLEVAVTLERPGFRVKQRKIKSQKVGKNQQVSKEQAITFVKSLGVKVE